MAEKWNVLSIVGAILLPRESSRICKENVWYGSGTWYVNMFFFAISIGKKIAELWYIYIWVPFNTSKWTEGSMKFQPVWRRDSGGLSKNAEPVLVGRWAIQKVVRLTESDAPPNFGRCWDAERHHPIHAGVNWYNWWYRFPEIFAVVCSPKYAFTAGVAMCW